MTSSRVLLSVSAIGLALGLLTGAGCSTPAQPVQDTAVFSQLGTDIGGGTHSAQECMLATGDWVIIGAIGPDRIPANSDVKPIQNGGINAGDSNQAFIGKTVSVDCSVAAVGAQFQVNAIAELQGVGTVTVSGTFDALPATGALPTQNGVTGIFERGDGSGNFKETDCKLSYPKEANGTQAKGIAPGRIWGQLDCPNVSTGGGMPRICGASAEIRFENCTQ